MSAPRRQGGAPDAAAVCRSVSLTAATFTCCVGTVLFFHFVPLALRWPVRVLAALSAAWLSAAAVRKLRAASFSVKKLVFSLLLAAFVCGALSLMCRVFLRVMSPRDEPLIVIIPGPLDVDDYAKGNERQYAPLLAHIRGKGWRCLDFLDPLAAKHRGDLSERAIFVNSHCQGGVNRELTGEIIRALGMR